MKQEPLDHHLLGKNRQDLESYRSFLNEEEAKDFTSFLEEHGILFSVESSGTLIDSAIVGDGLVPKLVVKIPIDDFKKVKALIAAQIRSLSPEELQSHYLNDLDNDELRVIIEKPDEWTAENIEVAKMLLEQRGVPIEEEELNEIEFQRFQELNQGKRGNRLYMCLYGLGIVAGLFTYVILTFAGVGMALYYAFGKDTDINGHKHFIYDAETRLLGKVMLYGGLLGVGGLLLYFFEVF